MKLFSKLISSKFYLRIEFLILIFFLVRLIGITNPPLEISHNWRQTTGLMVARNYLEVDPNILYPRIDDNNGESGIIGMEFPSMNYLYFLISKIFGFTYWYGRLINLIISSLGLFFFYKLIRQLDFSERTAYCSTLFLASSIWFIFSRKMMPDTYCISLMFIGLYYGVKYLNSSKIHQLILYVLLCSLAILSKIPAGIYFVVILALLFSKKYALQNRVTILAASAFPIILTYIWYFIWNTALSEKYGIWYNAGKPIKDGFMEITSHLGEALDNFYFDSFAGYIIFSFFVIGLILMIIKKEKKLNIGVITLFAIFLIYIFKSGFFFYHHNYYIIPFVPIMALVAGYAVSFIKKKWLLVTVILLGVGESIANQQHDLFIKDSEKYKLNLEPIMDKISDKNDLVMINGNGNPQTMFLSHRKGWNCNDEQLSDNEYISNAISNNCKFIIVNKHSSVYLNFLKSKYPIAYKDDDFVIFSVE